MVTTGCVAKTVSFTKVPATAMLTWLAAPWVNAITC